MNAFLNGGWIHYVSMGSPQAMPVVFVHGFPFSQEMWSAQIAPTATRCWAVAYDIRGHGSSDIGDGQYTIEGHVDDLIALLDHLRIPRAVVVGLSMGGYVTLRALARHPERFLGAVLCDTRSESDSDEGKLKRYEAIRTVKKEGSARFADDFVQLLFARESFTRKPEAVELIRTIIRRTPPLSIAGTLLALASRTDTTGSLGKISLPVLIIVGEHDVITPPASSRSLHERIRKSELHVVPDAGHMTNLENPEFFNEKLLGFLTKVGQSEWNRAGK